MKKRVITGAFIVAAILILYLLPTKLARIVIAVACGILAAMSFKETIQLKDSHKPYPNYIIFLAILCLELLVLNRINASYIYTGASYGMIGLILLILGLPAIFDKKCHYTTKEAFYLIGQVIFLGLYFNLIMLIFNTSINKIAGKWIFLYLILISTMTDTFAMLIGSLIGKHKLIPHVSPKKSVEGSVAGSLIATVVASIYYYNVIGNNINILLLILITLTLSILGQIGDLFFSKIKRENGIKDFSNILPGHGGILDRLDSLSFIIFGFVAIFNFIYLFL